MLLIRSEGDSFETLMHLCKIASGIILMVGRSFGGGSDDIKHLKEG